MGWIVVLVIALVATFAAMIVIGVKLERARDRADEAELEQRADAERHKRIDSATNDSAVRDRVRRVYTRNDPE